MESASMCGPPSAAINNLQESEKTYFPFDFPERGYASVSSVVGLLA